jgi:hypothetical protein
MHMWRPCFDGLGDVSMDDGTRVLRCLFSFLGFSPSLKTLMAMHCSQSRLDDYPNAMRCFLNVVTKNQNCMTISGKLIRFHGSSGQDKTSDIRTGERVDGSIRLCRLAYRSRKPCPVPDVIGRDCLCQSFRDLA